MGRARLPVTGIEEADELLVTDPLSLVIGMLLDQQVPMEWAFKGPFTLTERLDSPGTLDATAIAAMGPDALEEVFKEKPALHRYPGSMAKRTHALCEHIVEHHDGDAAKIWKGIRSGEKLYDRVRALPGYGDEKAKIFVAILAKRFDKTPAGWEEVAAPFSDEIPRSVADIDSSDALLEVRAWKKAQKAKGRSKQQ